MKHIKQILIAVCMVGLFTGVEKNGAPCLVVLIPCITILGLFIWANYNTLMRQWDY